MLHLVGSFYSDRLRFGYLKSWYQVIVGTGHCGIFHFRKLEVPRKCLGGLSVARCMEPWSKNTCGDRMLNGVYGNIGCLQDPPKHGMLTTVLLDAVRVNNHAENRAWVLERNHAHFTGIPGKGKVKTAICWGNDSTYYEVQNDEQEKFMSKTESLGLAAYESSLNMIPLNIAVEVKLFARLSCMGMKNERWMKMNCGKMHAYTVSCTRSFIFLASPSFKYRSCVVPFDIRRISGKLVRFFCLGC